MQQKKSIAYLQLMRFHKPIGIFLLLWPTLWALVLANAGKPPFHLIFIFITGVVIMRAAGCVINDFADRHIDGRVARTKDRPLATGTLSSAEALGLFVFLMILALALVCLTNWLTILLAIPAALLAVSYPFMKRVMVAPQLVLGLAFSWSIPMVYAASLGRVPLQAWSLYAIAVLWPIIYDTAYALTDREDDVLVGVKSTAIWLGDKTLSVILGIQGVMVALLMAFAWHYHLNIAFYVSLFGVVGLFYYQYTLLRSSDPTLCFKAFLNNNWVGAILLLGFTIGILR